MNLYILGDVRAVLEGKVTKERIKKAQTSTFHYGLGAIASIDLEMGEAISINQVAHGYCPNKRWSESEYFFSPFFIGIDKKPRNKVKIDSKTPLQEFYNSQISKYPNGFVVLGEVTFTKAYTRYLIKPPIYEESLQENLEQYIEDKDYINQKGFIFGVGFIKENPQMIYEKLGHSDLCFSHSHTFIDQKAYHLRPNSIIESAVLHIEGVDQIIES